MKDRYHIKINPSSPDAERIRQHQDFDALLKRIETTPSAPSAARSRPGRRVWLTTAAIAASLAILLVFNQLSNPAPASTLPLGTAEYVQPPVPNVANQEQTIRVDAERGGTYTTPSGTRLVVPTMAFANRYGSLVGGEVDIHIREMHDFVDIFLSGVPMDIKVDGQNRQLESAGMVEVYATQHGERITLMPEKVIELELRSETQLAEASLDDFNIYYLDEANRQWTYQAKAQLKMAPLSKTDEPQNESVLTPSKPLEPVLTPAQINQRYPMPKAPTPPVASTENGTTLELDFVGGDANAPQYAGTIWELAETNDEQLAQLGSRTWTQHQFEPQSDQQYKLVLSDSDEELVLRVRPVLAGADLERAQMAFAEQLAVYQKEKAQVEARRAAAKQRLAERNAQTQNLSDADFTSRMDSLRAAGFGQLATEEIMKRTVTSQFRITRFGTWNCDRPLPPYLLVLNGTFHQGDQVFNNTIVYHADQSRNTVSRFFLRDVAQLQFNEESKNLFWLLTDNQQLAVVRPEQVAAIPDRATDYAFDMTIEKHTITSEADVRRVLRFD